MVKATPSAKNTRPRRDDLTVCMLSVHTCPLAMLGGKETGGMNVYVRDLTIELGRRGLSSDVRPTEKEIADIFANAKPPAAA